MTTYVRNKNFDKRGLERYLEIEMRCHKAHPIIVVAGPSGSGKSLFVFKELLPFMHRLSHPFGVNVIEEANSLVVTGDKDSPRLIRLIEEIEGEKDWSRKTATVFVLQYNENYLVDTLGKPYMDSIFIIKCGFDWKQTGIHRPD